MIHCTTKKIKFVKIPVDTINYVISLEGMTSFRYQLWLFIYSLDPFGDRFVNIPSPEELAKQFNVNARTVKRAIDFLQERGLVDYQIEKWKIRNIIPKISDVVSDPPDVVSDPPDVVFDPPDVVFDPPDVVFDPNRLSKPAPQADSKSSHTIQTIQTFLYSSDPHPPTLREEKKEEGKNARADGKEVSKDVAPFANSTKGNSVCEAEIIQEKKSSAPRSTQAIRKTTDGVFGTPKPTREEIMNPYADGEWMKGNQLDPNFVEWLAKTWLSSDQEKYRDIHNAKKCVRLHLAKTQYALPIEWQQYHEETKHRYENAQTRITHGLNIPSEEQAMLASRAKAVVTPIEEFSNPIQVPTTPQPSLSPSVADNILRSPEDGGQYEENASAYKLWKPEEEQPDKEEAASVLQSLTLQMQKIRSGQVQSIEPIKSMSKQEPVQEKLSELEELNAWMSDRILRKEAIARVKKSDRYTFEYDDDGSPLNVIEPDF